MNIPSENLISRRARKGYDCAGDGGRPARHAEGCPLEIKPGELYVECMETAHAFASGTRHSLACAGAYLGFEGTLDEQKR